MDTHFLIASSREEDLRFGEFLAFANDLSSKQVTTPEALNNALTDHPKSIVLWDAEDSSTSMAFSAVLSGGTIPGRIFAVTSKPLSAYNHLVKAPVFSHHFLRRFDDPSPTLYARLVGASLHPAPFGLARYFPEVIEISDLPITRSGQKRAAIESVQEFFIKHDVNSRLAAVVAQACDELIMNAIFDAPTLPNGLPLRRGTDRAVDFELISQEHVQVQMALSEEYAGISVSDQFGSLKRSVLMGYLCQDYCNQKYEIRSGETGAGLGLHGVVQSGLSLLFVCTQGVRTDVMIFFAKDASYKTFRSGFRFSSVIAP